MYGWLDDPIMTDELPGEDVLRRAWQRTRTGYSYLLALLTLVICTLLCWAIRPLFSPANLVMIYLVGVVFVSIQAGRGPSIAASILSVIAFDFFFVPPYFSLGISDTEYLLTFVVMLLVALTISDLTNRVRQQAEAARERERRTASLYAMSRAFANSQGIDNLTRVAAEHIGEVFNSRAFILLPDTHNQVSMAAQAEVIPQFDQNEQSAAQWVYEHKQPAGLNTNTLPRSQGYYVPLMTSRGPIGVLAMFPEDRLSIVLPDQVHILETFANQTALAIERARFAEETEKARIQVETERQRNTLLSSISHDLRTPLASITGAVSSLLENEDTLDRSGRHDLAQLAYEEARRLNRQISNLLDMTRLASGAVKVVKEWQSLEEVIGSALNLLTDHLADHPVRVSLPDDMPLVPFDSLLIGQVFANLLENAAKYTPPGTVIEITARVDGNGAAVEVADRGPGLPPGEEQHVFDKFYRASPQTARGIGLGLTICRGIIEAHGGRIWAENRVGGGAIFRFTLPFDGRPPEVKAEDGDAV